MYNNEAVCNILNIYEMGRAALHNCIIDTNRNSETCQNVAPLNHFGILNLEKSKLFI